MGITIQCESLQYSCGYSFWNTVREEIAKAAIEHLRVNHNKMEEAGETDSYNYRQLSNVIEYADENNCGTIPDFMYLLENMDFLNTLIYYNLGGVYSIINKSDDTGYYTAGNSLDIVQTIDIVSEYIEYSDVRAAIPNIKKVFDHSVEKRKMVLVD